jgi:hypothetical protein
MGQVPEVQGVGTAIIIILLLFYYYFIAYTLSYFTV